MVPPTDPSARLPLPTRQRLPAEMRIHQILDAALQTFARHGFAATRIDDIAQQAGLSKGGIYTHFRSKDEIFEALLAREMAPAFGAAALVGPDEPVTMELVLERVFDPIYERLMSEDRLLVIRLMVADGPRMPDLVARWHRAVSEPHVAGIGTLVRQGVAQGHLRDGIAVREPWLLLAPVAYGVMNCLRGGVDVRQAMVACRKAHALLLRELLEVRPRR